MPRKRKSPAGLIVGDLKNRELWEINEGEKDSQSFTLIQLTPREKFQGWRKIYGRIAVGERDGEIFINPGILGPWAGLCAIIDQVAVCMQNEPLFVPISWAIREYPQHAEDLKTLISHVERALREEDSK